MSASIQAAWLAADGLKHVLQEDLLLRGVTVTQWHGMLALSSQKPVYSPWALDIWTAPQKVNIQSIRDASDTLRAIQRNWSLYAADCFRRAGLIVQKLPPVKAAPLVFPAQTPTSPLGAWTLLNTSTMLFSA
ncbi:MAG: hypothetical protein ABF705_08295, partial [Acetobacter syzygii]